MELGLEKIINELEIIVGALSATLIINFVYSTFQMSKMFSKKYKENDKYQDKKEIEYKK